MRTLYRGNFGDTYYSNSNIALSYRVVGDDYGRRRSIDWFMGRTLCSRYFWRRIMAMPMMNRLFLISNIASSSRAFVFYWSIY